MAWYAITGWEGGTNNECYLSGGTYEVSASAGRDSDYGFRAYPTTTATGYTNLATPSTSTGGNAEFDLATLYCSFDFKIVTLPGSGAEEFWCSKTASGSSYKLSCRINSSGNVVVYVGGTTLLATGTAALSTGTWYRVNVKSPTGTNVAWEVTVDNGTVESLSGTCTSANNNARVAVGKSVDRSSQTVDFYYDNMLVGDSAYADQGARIKLMSPDGDGTNTAWTIGSGSGAEWTIVDDLPVAGATDYLVSTGTSGDESGVTLESTTTAGISGTIVVAKYMTYSRTQSGTGSFKMRIRSGSNTIDLITLAPGNTGTAYAQMSVNDPATSAAWTTSGLDSAELCSVENMTGTPYSRWYYGHLCVAYVPASSGVPKMMDNILRQTWA